MTADTILKNATKEELANAVEENVVAMFRSMTQVLNGDAVVYCIAARGSQA